VNGAVLFLLASWVMNIDPVVFESEIELVNNLIAS
jgi:hypothetical protein